MAIARLEPSQVAPTAVRSLGLDPAVVELNSAEAVTASVRRAASFLCPTTPRALVRAVAEALCGLPNLSAENAQSRVEAAVELLVSHGDLLELPLDDAGGTQRHLFLGPPSFVRRTPGYLLLGVRPEGAPILGEELVNAIDYLGHLRIIRSDACASLDEALAGEGLTELQPEHWLRAPRKASPQELVDSYVARLGASPVAGDIEGMRIIDPESDIAFYRGRWRSLRANDGGRFVCRRSQAYGADVWCFAEVVDGTVTRLIDLPIESALARGSDEAWRLQAALDALGRRPQTAQLRRPPNEAPALLDLFSPLPSWSQRRLDALATPAPRSRGALFSYALRPDDVDAEIQFLQEMMWMSVDRATG